MLELPETTILAGQLNDMVVGRTIDQILPPTKPHKFCFFTPEPDLFQQDLLDARITGAEGFGIYAELTFDNGKKLCISDGVNLRLLREGKEPSEYQLLIKLSDKHSLVFTVAMYGSITLHDDTFDNKYYLASRNAITPFSQSFHDEFRRRLLESKPTLSAKAFLATEQRFPGIGNGVLQDILYEAGIHPKRKVSSLSDEDMDRLELSVVSTLREMIRLGGRDTEKDLFDQSGGYITAMSKNTVGMVCKRCGAVIVKENYMGGSVCARALSDPGLCGDHTVYHDEALGKRTRSRNAPYESQGYDRRQGDRRATKSGRLMPRRVRWTSSRRGCR